MVVCIPNLKPSQICKYGKLSHAFLAPVGMQLVLTLEISQLCCLSGSMLASRLLKHLDMLRGLMLTTVTERVRISWNSAEASRQYCLCSLSSGSLQVVQVA